MRLLEHEGKAIFSEFAIPLTKGKVVHSQAEAVGAASEIGYPLVVKAQVLAGGRGKAGGVKIAKDEAELARISGEILGMTIKGETCSCLLLTQCVDIAREFYLGITLDSGAGFPLLLFSTAGGIDIETVAATQPEKLLRRHLDELRPLEIWQAMNFLLPAKLPSDIMFKTAKVVVALTKAFFAKEAHTTEINPLVVTSANDVLALDAKVVLDNDSLKRLGIPKTDGLPVTELEKRAASIGIRYVQLEGDIAVLGGGAGVGMATMDMVHFSGHKPACVIDCGGGITAEATAEAVRICLDTPGAKGVIFNAFGGGNNCETMAKGVVLGMKDRPNGKIVVKMRGHSQDEGWALLRENNIPFVQDETSAQAIQKLISMI